MRALAPSLPAGVRVEPVYDQAVLVDESMALGARRDPDRHRAVRAGDRPVPAQPARRRDRRAGGAADAGHEPARRRARRPEPESDVAGRPGGRDRPGDRRRDRRRSKRSAAACTRASRPPAAALSGPRLLLAALRRHDGDDGGGVHPARAARRRGRPVLHRAGGDAGRGGGAVAGGVADAGAAARAALAGRGAAAARRQRGSPPATRALLRPCLRQPAWLALGARRAAAARARSRCGAVPSGFLPTMDEGAFVLDYFLPAGHVAGRDRRGRAQDRGRAARARPRSRPIRAAPAPSWDRRRRR